MKKEQQNHLTDEELNLCWKETISFAEKEKYLAHIEHCTYCSDRFANQIPLDFMPPAYLEAEILDHVETMQQQWKKQLRKTSKEVQLFFYSLKVAFTVSVSIVLLFICVGSYHELGSHEGLHERSSGIMQNRYEPRIEQSVKLKDKKPYKENKSLSELLNKFAEDCFGQY